MLGVSFVRVIDCSVEDYRYGVAINRIRHYYNEIAGDNEATLFLLLGHDDARGVFANAALPSTLMARRRFDMPNAGHAGRPMT